MAEVTLNATWQGPRPSPGHYLKAERGRIAYQILRVDVAIGQPSLGTRRLRLRCAKVEPKHVPEGATVHVWKWNRRTARTARRLRHA